ncbi:hypothetical protein [Clostridium saccharoperbutylacetonicum]|uniref:hypothetical protein n=1 Tax=Clostridium saccharoperbutylacetonicum TaxID=36745 RepID=UPI0009839531|nr:hypothetical protein [Clostridium saccharoperbutylacetonicum]AQR95564.1 hypothetical protein CLSAP_28800 [Clostridium saccharoperbutylacetonicum]NSB31424.1 hypothetical protein [Clostridium saccharoperbutylacetonicum]
MRSGIREKIINTVTEIENCYEPNVPTKDTLKPYAIVVQGDDTNNGEVVGFKRTIEVWLYETRTTFKNLDSLADKVIKALDMQVITDSKTNETFTCIFGGMIGQDVVDTDWDAIARGLQFSVIALHEDDEVNLDPWLDALKEYTNKITGHKVYLNYWSKSFEIPSILWRVKSQSKERETNALIKESKTIICHVASNSKNEINNLLDDIENRLVSDLKIPLNLADKRYLTIESIDEDREADMLSKGQLTVKFSRRKMIQINNGPTIDKIHSRGSLNEE